MGYQCFVNNLFCFSFTFWKLVIYKWCWTYGITALNKSAFIGLFNVPFFSLCTRIKLQFMRTEKYVNKFTEWVNMYPEQYISAWNLYVLIKDVSIFALTEYSREPLCSVCSSYQNHLSYFVGDGSQSVVQTETMRSLTWVFYYFLEPFWIALSSKVHSLFLETVVTVQSIDWRLSFHNFYFKTEKCSTFWIIWFMVLSSDEKHFSIKLKKKKNVSIFRRNQKYLALCVGFYISTWCPYIGSSWAANHHTLF